MDIYRDSRNSGHNSSKVTIGVCRKWAKIAENSRREITLLLTKVRPNIKEIHEQRNDAVALYNELMPQNVSVDVLHERNQICILLR